MTAIEMLKKAMRMLGYTDGEGNVTAGIRFKGRAIDLINLVYADLFYIVWSNNEDPSIMPAEFKPIMNPGDKINLPNRVLYDIMPYGVAMRLAESENDGDQQANYAYMYNQKRNALTKAQEVLDVLPRAGI